MSCFIFLGTILGFIIAILSPIIYAYIYDWWTYKPPPSYNYCPKYHYHVKHLLVDKRIGIVNKITLDLEYHNLIIKVCSNCRYLIIDISDTDLHPTFDEIKHHLNETELEIIERAIDPLNTIGSYEL